MIVQEMIDDSIDALNEMYENGIEKTMELTNRKK